ncbi:unnamed protein product, partial [Staurois parvus]
VHTQKYTCTDPCTYTCTYIHTHVHTDTCTYIHTKHTHVQYMHTHTYTHIHVHTRRHMYRYTQAHKHRHTHTHPIKSCSTLLFTHRAGYCTLGGGREHSTHVFLCFHCVQLLSSLAAPSANDRYGLSSESAQQDSPGGTHSLPP